MLYCGPRDVGGGTGPSIDWEASEWGAYPSALTLERLKKHWQAWGGRGVQVGLVTLFERRGGTRRDGGGAHPRLGARGG